MTEPNKPIKRPRLRLPFDNRKADTGAWAYDHRIGLCVTLIVYLVLAIAFVAGKIVVGSAAHTQGMYIDLQTLTALEEERDKLEQQTREKQQNQDNVDWKRIQNLVSNENATEEDNKHGSRGQAAGQSAESRAVNDRMRANREAYEQGLAEEQAIRAGKSGMQQKEAADKRVKGRVTVSFSLVDPVRMSRQLVIPAYQCEGGGQVVVAITVNTSGEVLTAKVESGGDDCMRETAVRAARNSRFNIDTAAPARQSGTITYIFIPQ